MTNADGPPAGDGDARADDAPRADDGTARSVDPDPFATLGNETRLRVVDALYEATNAAGVGDGCPYSTLRERAAVDDKGNFNYHLDVLRDRFVEKRDGEYRLTFAGFEVAKTLRADAWSDHEPRGPERVAESSPLVGGRPLYATYEDSLVEVHADGEDPVFRIAVRPTGAARRDLDDLVDVAVGSLADALESTRREICPYCHASPDRTVVGDAGNGDEEARWTYRFEARCPECGPLFEVPVGMAVVRHPAVVSFYWDRGVDVRSKRPWDLDPFGDGAVERLADDPPRFRATVERDGRRLTLTLDGSGNVVESGTNGVPSARTPADGLSGIADE